MFRRYYTTQMSDSVKQLQMRFTRIRTGVGKRIRYISVITAIVVLLITAYATITMAAIDSDGLEYRNNRELYFLAGFLGDISSDMSAVPQWINNISSNGEIDVIVQRVDIREINGIVKHKRIITLSGDIGSINLNQVSSCGYRGLNNEFILFVTDISDSEINPYGEMNINEAYITFGESDSDIASLSGKGFEYFLIDINNLNKYNFVKINNIREIGDFVKIENTFWNSICINYYTYYESNFKNRSVDGIDISIISQNENSVKIKADIDIPQAYYLETVICPAEYVAKFGFGINHLINEVNGKELLLEYNYPPKHFEKGRAYTINYVIKDLYENVIYRQQDYFTF